MVALPRGCELSSNTASDGSRLYWKNRNVFVTGGAGFVGSWLVRSLSKQGARVTVLVRDIHPTTFQFLLGKFADTANIVTGDLCQTGLVDRILRQYDIDFCFHLAAQAIVNVALNSPVQAFETNIRGTLNLLEASRRYDAIEGVIVASTDKVYGEPTRLPIDEDHPLLGLNPYDASKVCADVMSRSYYETYSLPIGVTRCSNVYGGGDMNFTRIIPSVIRDLINGTRPVIRSDGSPVRDYLYISDAIGGYTSLAENLHRPEVKGRAFNFGTGRPTSVKDLVGEITEVSGRRDLMPIFQGREKHFIHKQYVNSNKAKNLLNWHPKVELKDGVKHTFQWYHKHSVLWRNSLSSQQ